MAVESKSGGPGHNSGWYNHLIERKTQSVVGSLRQVHAALTVLDGMSKGVARVLNASRLKSIRPCNVRVLSLSVEIVDLETSGKTSDLLEVDSRGSLHLQGLYGNIHIRGSPEVRLRHDQKHPYTRIKRGKVKA